MPVAYGTESTVTVRDLLTAGGTPDVAVAQLGVLWGKSAERGGGQPSLLVTHLLDTAAVAEVMWDEYLAPMTQGWLDALAAGDGRRFFAWVCGVHDVGKASPAFQRKSASLAAGVKAAGLEWTFADTSYRDWGHWLAGGVIVQARLKTEEWSEPARRVLGLSKARIGPWPWWAFTRFVRMAPIEQTEHPHRSGIMWVQIMRVGPPGGRKRFSRGLTWRVPALVASSH